MELTQDQKQMLFTDGYIKLPGIVPRTLIDNALRAINMSLGEQGMHPDNLQRYRAQSYCPELQRTPVIAGLFNDSPLLSLAESAIGAGKIAPITSGQIALRFPQAQMRPPHAHIDGMYSPNNGVPEGTIANFTALVGVMLSDLPNTDAGNLAVWPGTHRTFERYFQQHGPQSLLNGMPQVEMPAPQQITGKAGDAVLCHYQLAHGISGNGSPHIRYAIYFRLSHIDHASVKWECMTDIWREWEGMQDMTIYNG